MQDFNITVSKSTGEVWLNQYTIGRDSENLQKNFVFGFSDEFVNGQARLEMSIDGQDSWITLTKDNDNETYYVPIQSAVTKCGKIFMQLVITEGEIEEGIPIFKSNVFYVFVDESINAEIEQPEEYPTWIEIANEKLNEIDNLDIEATKEDDTATITITKKDGTEQSVEIKDGETGPQGATGPAGQDATINGVNTLNIVAGDNIEIEQENNTMTISSTGGGGGASEYVVRLTKENDEITSDKTISEIITAYNNGNIVKGVLTDTEAGVDFNLQLLIAFEDSDFGLVQFATVYDSGDDFKSITIIGTLENNEDSWQCLDREMAYTAGTGIEITSQNVINNTLTKTSDLTNDSDFVSDSSYVHTDNNYTNAEKNKLAGLENKIINVNADQQTMQFDKSADEINEYLTNGYIVMALGYQVFRRDYNASTHTIKLAIYFGSFGQVITVVGNQITGVDEYFYVNDQNYVHTDNNFSSYYKNMLDNAPEVVDLSSYSVGDTIDDYALVSQLINNRCKVKYGNTIYSYATTMGTGYIYTVMNSLTAGAYIVLNYDSNNNTFYFYEVGTAPWESPNNKVTSLSSSSTDTEYPSAKAVYDKIKYTNGSITTESVQELGDAFGQALGEMMSTIYDELDNLPKTYTGYDATKTQVLKNINGTLTWVDET